MLATETPATMASVHRWMPADLRFLSMTVSCRKDNEYHSTKKVVEMVFPSPSTAVSECLPAAGCREIL